MTRNPRIDPQPGDRIEHPDGGVIEIRARRPRTVLICAPHTHGYSQWMRLSTFQRLVAGQQVLSVQHKETTPCTPA